MDEIEGVARTYAAAVLARDASALLALYDADALVFDLWDRWSYRGRDAWGGSVAEWFGSLGEDRVRVAFEPLSCVVEGDWAVWCAFTRYSGVSPAGEVLRSMQNRLSWSLRRRDGRWLIVHEHSSAPVDPETLTVSLARGDAQ